MMSPGSLGDVDHVFVEVGLHLKDGFAPVAWWAV